MTSTRARVCGEKRKLTRQEAESTLERLVTGGAAPGLMNAYRCDVCGSWHVGHTRNRRRRRR